jgi:hypothetical protein
VAECGSALEYVPQNMRTDGHFDANLLNWYLGQNDREEYLVANSYQLTNIRPDDYGRLHNETGTFLVYGKLNIAGFNPVTSRGFTISECESALFYGLEPVPGEVNDDNHCIVVHRGYVHCANLLDADGNRFVIPASKVLPLTKARKNCTPCRRVKKHRHAYLASISRVFEIKAP